MYNFNSRFTELYQESGLTTRQLAKELGVGATTISDWKNATQSVKLQNLLKICNYFNCSLNFIAGLTDIQLDFTPQTVTNFYNNLKRVIKECGKTQYRIEKDLKLSSGHFDQWKKGSDPSLDTLLKLSNYLGVTLDYLVGREK